MRNCAVFVVLVTLTLLSLPFHGSFVLADDVSGQDIMHQVDENQFIASGRMESQLVIYDRGRERVKEMIAYVQSDGTTTHALAEFINPRDRGTKYLLKEDELWMFFPDAEDTVRISGHMLQEGMMGSDFSYQDALESERITELYTFTREADDTVNDREVFIVHGQAKDDVDAAYAQRRFWVDTERFVILQEEMYARDGRLLKRLVTEEVEEVADERWMPMKVIMEDKLRADTHTTFHITQLDLDYAIPDGKISLESLR